MYSKTKLEQFGVVHYDFDAAAELNTLPTNDGVGSTATCLATSKQYMLNGSKQWVEVTI